jgi:hypothetical protein
MRRSPAAGEEKDHRGAVTGLVLPCPRFLLVTSANFSRSAETGNLELGVLTDNANLAEAVEHEMRQAEDFLFEKISLPR